MKHVLFLLIFLVLVGCGSREQVPAKPSVSVKVALTRTETVEFSIQAPASIFPRQQANVASRITAPIRELRAQKGDRVAAGQTLAVLDDRDLLAQRAEAVAAVEDARQTLEKLSSGTLPADVERARGQVAAAEAALNQAQKIYERRQQLFKDEAIPERDLLVSQTELAKAQVDYDVARRSLDLFLHHSRESDVRIAQSRLEQAQAKLALVETQVGYASLRSPFAGVITDQFLYPGDMAKPDAPVFTVMDFAAVVARAQVPEKQAETVRQGQPCSFTAVDYPGMSFQGKISVVSKVVDAARRSVEVWCEIPDNERLRAGVFGDLKVLTGMQPGSVVAPLPAVQLVEGTSRGSVLVVDSHKIVHLRQVVTGRIFDGKVQITSGLKPGELVVVEGGYGLPDGTEVHWEGTPQ